MMATALTRLLNRTAIRSDVIDSAQAALSLLGAEHVDAVGADYHLGDGSGLDCLATVAARHPDVCRVLMTGAMPLNGDDDLRDALGGVVHVVLYKPFTRDELLKAITAGEAARSASRKASPVGKKWKSRETGAVDRCVWCVEGSRWRSDS